MILRRLSKHVKNQNWFAVVLDFLIVVVGILIAFQITNWSTNHQNKLVYDQALERVIVELDRNLELQDRVRANIAKELPIIQRALEDLRACRADEASLANVKAALVPLNAPYVHLSSTTALEQFLGNNAFLQYQSLDTRKRLTELLRYFRHFLEWDRLRQAQMVAKAVSLPDSLALGSLAVSGPDDILNVMLSDSPLSPPLYRELILTAPLAVVCKDKAFVAAFYDWESGAFKISIEAGLLQPRIREALDALGRPVVIEDRETP